jgi:hypothetical protein
MTERHEASGRLRTAEEVHTEIKDRQATIKRLQAEMTPLSSHSEMWKAKMVEISRHTTVIAVLRWVLGEDMLWE